jgi:hypothetical protein
MPKKYSNDEYIKIFNESYPTLELLSEYNGDKKYITVRCKIHDYIFNTKPNWLKKGQGCQKCYDDRRGNYSRKTTQLFIEDAKKVHGDKYDYSQVEYKNARTKVCIICPQHGEFWQTPVKHISSKQGCPKCGDILNGFRKRIGNENFIKHSKKIHNNKYDYSKVEYINIDTKVCIICPQHGEFWQTPYCHLNGHGCPICNESHLEKAMKNILLENNIEFEQQKKFEWLGRQSLDFYLPQYNIGIECQGGQHFQSVKHFGGEEEFKKTLLRDKIKKQKCETNNLKLFYVVDDINNIKLKGFQLKKLYNSLYDLNKINEKINKIKNILG